jgi:hypothetical protein
MDCPFRLAVELLTTIPGISELSARIIDAEIGTDMSRFPTTGSRMAPVIMTSDQIISTAVPEQRKPSAWSPDFRTSAMSFRSRLWPHETVARPQFGFLLGLIVCAAG